MSALVTSLVIAPRTQLAGTRDGFGSNQAELAFDPYSLLLVSGIRPTSSISRHA
jgi:hypothetical protein